MRLYPVTSFVTSLRITCELLIDDQLMLSESSYERELHNHETERLDAQQTAGFKLNAVRGAANETLLACNPGFSDVFRFDSDLQPHCPSMSLPITAPLLYCARVAPSA